jgi:hypothetical protein
MTIRTLICSAMFAISINGWALETASFALSQQSANHPDANYQLNSALQQEEEKTLLSTPVKQGVYATPVLKFGSFGSENKGSLIVGAQGGWILDRKFVLGLGVYGLSSRVKADDTLWQIAGMVDIFNYGGVFFSYIHNSYNLIHAEVTTLIGVGEANYHDEEYWAKYPKGDNFFVLEPGVNAIVNITPGFRVGAGLSYRYVDRLNLIGLEKSDVSGLNFNLLFQVGYF